MAKQYWLFGGFDHYPSGGMLDFRGEFSDVRSATEHGEWCRAAEYGDDKYEEHRLDWWQVVDTSSNAIVAMFPPKIDDWPYGDKAKLSQLFMGHDE